MSAELPATDDAPASPEASETVKLSFPLRPDLVYLGRMTAAAEATRAGFGFDQVEDLRLAIDELCITIAGEDDSDGRLDLVFEWTPDSIKVVGTLVATGRDLAQVPEPATVSGTGGPTPRELSERILDALVDEHGLDNAGGAPRGWMVLRRREGTS